MRDHVERTLKLRGISRRQIHDDLIRQGGLCDGNIYRFADHIVRIDREEEVMLRVIAIVEIDVTFEGPLEIVDRAYERFHLAFMRMGG